MNTFHALPILADIAGKPVGVESLLGPLGELLHAMVDFVWWSIWGKGFACGVLVVLVPVVTALVFAVAVGMVSRKGSDEQ
jgi:hypothetical protein